VADSLKPEKAFSLSNSAYR